MEGGVAADSAGRGRPTASKQLCGGRAPLPLTRRRVALSGATAQPGISMARSTLANGTRSIAIEPQTECYDGCFGARAEIIVTHAAANLFCIVWTQRGGDARSGELDSQTEKRAKKKKSIKGRKNWRVLMNRARP